MKGWMLHHSSIQLPQLFTFTCLAMTEYNKCWKIYRVNNWFDDNQSAGVTSKKPYGFRSRKPQDVLEDMKMINSSTSRGKRSMQIF